MVTRGNSGNQADPSDTSGNLNPRATGISSPVASDNGSAGTDSLEIGATITATPTAAPGTPGDTINGFPVASAPGDTGSTYTVPGKRGRHKLDCSCDKCRTRKAGQNSPVVKSLANIEGLLYSVHCMGAVLLQVPELEVSKEEAAKLADAIKEVAKYYPIGISDKAAAWTNLIFVAGGMYGKRVIDVRFRLKKEASKKVVSINGAHNKGANGSAANFVPAPAAAPTKGPGVGSLYAPAPVDGSGE